MKSFCILCEQNQQTNTNNKMIRRRFLFVSNTFTSRLRYNKDKMSCMEKKIRFQIYPTIALIRTYSVTYVIILCPGHRESRRGVWWTIV